MSNRLPKPPRLARSVDSGVALRPAQNSDLGVIIDIYNQSIHHRLATADLEPVSIAERLPWFRAHEPSRRPIVIAEGVDLEQAQQVAVVLGWLSFSDFYGRPAYGATAEVSIYVADGAQRLGIGRTLLAHAENLAPELGLTSLLGFIFDHNTPSISLFSGFGFTEWGHLPDVAMLDGISRGVLILGKRLRSVEEQLQG